MARGRDQPSGAAASPTPLASIPGHLIRRSQAVHNALWAELMPGGLTSPQYAVLAVLTAYPRADQQQVARLASLDRSSAADVVARLERKAWIERHRNPGDARRYMLSPTEAASIALAAITPQVRAVQDTLLAVLAAGRRTAFVDDLAAVARLPADALRDVLDGGGAVVGLTAPGHLIRCAQQVHTATWADTMHGGLTGPQYAVLHVIGRWPGINQRRLGELAALDSSTTTDIVNRLAGRDWIAREKDPADGRGRVLTLTREATTRLRDIHPKVALVQQRLLEPLPAHGRAGFLRDLARVAFVGNPPDAAT